MKIYATDKGYTLSLKNNLERAIDEYLSNEIDRKFIQPENLESFKEQIKNKIQQLNLENKRCKPIIVDFWKYPGRNDYQLEGLEFTRFTIKEFESWMGK